MFQTPTNIIYSIFYLLMLLPTGLFSQKAGFIKNKGQWATEVKYKMNLPNGAIWFEKTGWMISLLDQDQLADVHDKMHGHEVFSEPIIDGHVLSVELNNANQHVKVYGKNVQKAYHNYFIGGDRTRWKGNVPVYDSMVYEGIYDEIDLVVDLHGVHPKMTYVVKSGADLKDILLQYHGHRGLNVENRSLEILTPVGSVVENELLAYQIVNGSRTEVPCSFVRAGDCIGFHVGDFDKSKTLFIDPVVIASTNSGSTVSCYGHTATFDNPGNIYAAGRCFGPGYPTDTGSFQINYGGGGTDMAVTKYNPDGSELIYATYLGGSTQDLPHSMFVNSQGRLHILGTSNSTDFPVTANAYDTSHNEAYDITVTIFNDSGTALIGSTYVGGTGEDGHNSIGVNYGDPYRGEIIVDGFNYVYVASVSQSADFPVTSGVVQDTLAGLQDAVVFKLNFNLSQLVRSTYLGGSGPDAAYGLKLDESLNIYVSGSTAGQGFPIDSSSNSAFPNYLGGITDGFILKLSSNASTILYSSYFGTPSQDQNFFVQVDQLGDIYLYGQSGGSISSTSGKYQGPALGSYIYKTSPELDTIYWVTGFGNMAPTAFLVDLCSHIYVAGHGSLSSLPSANFDTVDAVLNLGSAGFYLMALSPDASTLEFGSFYGNEGSHVDGGTSRFDKRGFVYEATCSGGYFPLTSWAYSANQAAGAYDVTVFKIDFEVDGVVAYSSASPNNVGCVPFSVDFSNIGSTGSFNFWDFGEGTTSTDSMPTHVFDSVGVYEVIYVASDSVGCNLVDTNVLYITVLDTISPQIVMALEDCVDSVSLFVDAEYSDILWSTGDLSMETWATDTGLYWVEVNNECGTFVDTEFVSFEPPYAFDLIADTGICDPDFEVAGPSTAQNYEWNTGDTTQVLTIPATGQYILTADNGICEHTDTVNIEVSYTDFSSSDTVVCEDSLLITVENKTGTIQWSTGDTTEQVTINSAGTYWVYLENGYCSTTDTLDVSFNPAYLTLPTDTVICSPMALQAFHPSLISYQWSTGDTTSSITVGASSVYWVIGHSEFCNDTDSVAITREYLEFDSVSELVCDLDSHALSAPGPNGSSFFWSTGDSTRNIIVTSSGDYEVSIFTPYCNGKDTLRVVFASSPEFSLGPDRVICKGEQLELVLDTTINTPYWSTNDTGRAITISDSGLVWVSMNQDGCEGRDSIHISLRSVDVDSFAMSNNVMTPNDDGLNDVLEYHVEDESLVKSYHIQVFNRWGTLVFESYMVNDHWDGTLAGGKPANDGVYFYTIECETVCELRPVVTIRDNVTLLRQ